MSIPIARLAQRCIVAYCACLGVRNRRERSTVNRAALLRTAGLATLVLTLLPATTPGKAQEPIVFGVIGDTGLVTPGLRGVAREMLAYRRDRTRFDFDLMLGDNIYTDGVGRGIESLRSSVRRSPGCGGPVYAVLGNHDIAAERAEIHDAAWNMKGRRSTRLKRSTVIEFFGLDSTAHPTRPALSCSSKKRGSTTSAPRCRRKKTTLTASERRRLEKLNAELGEDVAFINEQAAVKNAQLVWLRDALANSQARWKVVFLHHSIYSAATRTGGHGGERSVLRLWQLLEPIFVDRGVDLVLAGHDHHYDRSTLQPANASASHQVQYVTAGASAKVKPNAIDHANRFLAKADGTTHSFLTVQVTHDAIRIEAIGANGKTLDRFEVVKRPLTSR